MLLAINCGNTNVVFAVYHGAKQRGAWRAATDPRRTADEYLVWLKELIALDGIRPKDIDGAIISSVVPDALFALKTLCRRYFACDPLVIGEDGCKL
ncbi:MAG TPA: type III pantothenate kinase, partial [Alphaproteobacteria bacterium]|nr:type III pantothenate kinase [Alphaproteobacteria bacterium]